MSYASPEAQREYQRKWRQRRRDEFFVNKACIRCDSTDRLELDHKDPSKKVSHKIWSWSLERRLEEIAKCQVLCHECHVLKTREDNPLQPCGTVAAYRRGCRCAECRGALAARRRHERARSKTKA